MATKKSPEVFSLKSATTSEVESGSEVLLPCGLYAGIIPSVSTERQAEHYRKAVVKIGGKKALEDPARLAGGKSVRAAVLVLSRYNLRYLRTPNGLPLDLSGVTANGKGPHFSYSATIDAEKDLAEILTHFPQIMQEVRDAVEAEGESLDEIGEALAGN